MKVLLKKDWCYTLHSNNEEYLLEVICGTVALYEIKISLNREEIEKFLSHGEPYIIELAEDISKKPTVYLKRSIKN